ncbi:MAG: cupin domain-containing protein [Deltaproteobacteria bacterium]|nr:cupin domain-containing protein [Deltaproteobacteria bacterium]
MSEQKHTFVASFLKDAKFEGGGLRDYFVDRDLGIDKATGGMVTAIVHRASAPCPDDGPRHIHKVDFQMNYMLKGWCKFEFEGQGEIVFNVGDSWLQPPGIPHTLLEYSDDFEVLEIVMPGTFETEDL